MADAELYRVVTEASPYSDENIHPLVLLKILQRDFGVNWVLTLPDSIFLKIKQQQSVEVHPVVRDKICAIKNLLNSASFFDNWVAFEKTVVAFNDRPVDFTLMQYVSVLDIYFALNVVKEIRNEPLGPDPRVYIYAVCRNEAVYYMPEPMNFINAMHKTDSERVIMQEQQKLFDDYVANGVMHPQILQQIRALTYNRIKQLNRIHEEQLYGV